ncbi:MAG: radical SAM protein [Candidatus Krumholzibacteria bacterium]|nr:radical SAM protein [Candidatus Krumholzibacteria bacterium]
MEDESGAYPSYLALLESGELAARRDRALAMLESCSLCPRACGVNRLGGEKGVCRVARRAVVSSAHAHFGEEAPLVGTAGSGTIFFSGCNLKCLFCQNYEISHLLAGDETSANRLAFLMLRIQEMGCHNLNLVTPTHVLPQILEALEIAAGRGLRLPLVYNTGGYDSIEAIRLLDGIVDIYMPDVKYLSAEAAAKYSGAADYPEVIREATREMHRQVGDLEIAADGIARRGLLVRHLVMPGMLGDVKEIAAFLAGEISRDTYINVMAQYRPEYLASEHPPLDRPLSRDEWTLAVRLARAAGLRRFDES